MNILFIAAPGAGKGTYSKMFEEKYNLFSLSTGNIIRKVINKGGKLGKELNNIIKVGSFIDDDLVLELLKNECNEISKNNNNNGMIFDGFPRNLEQVKMFEEFLYENNLKLNYVINLDIELDLIKERILHRLVCSNCDSVFNSLYYKEKTCDKCNSVLQSRSDDNIDSINKRYDIYLNKTSKLLSYFEQREGTKLITVKIEKDFTVEQVFNLIKKNVMEDANDYYKIRTRN